jgi:hypothetical protein
MGLATLHLKATVCPLNVSILQQTHFVINENWQWVNNQKFPLLAQWNTHTSTRVYLLQFLILHFSSCTVYFIQFNLLFNIVIHVNKTWVSSTYSSNVSPPHHARLKAGIHKSQAPGKLGNYFCKVAPIICKSSIWTLFQVPLLVPTILRCFLNFWNICVPLA